MITLDIHGHYFSLIKSDAFHAIKKLAKVIQNKKNIKIASIRSDHGGEFENKDFESFCDEHGIEHNFSLLNKMELLRGKIDP